MHKAIRKLIVTVRVSLFHSDVIVRLLDMLFFRPLKWEYTLQKVISWLNLNFLGNPFIALKLSK